MPISNQFPLRFSLALGDDLSRLVHQRAARKPISDARTATYVILTLSSGPGGRWFKSTRPDHSFRISDIHHTKSRRAPGPKPSVLVSHRLDASGLCPLSSLHCNGEVRLTGNLILGKLGTRSALWEEKPKSSFKFYVVPRCDPATA